LICIENFIVNPDLGLQLLRFNGSEEGWLNAIVDH